jgi:hypothetical protein
MEVNGADSDDRWKFVWLDKNKEIIKEFEDLYFVKEGDYFYGNRSINPYVPEDMDIEGVPIFGFPDIYYIEFYHNNELIDSKQFEIIDTDITFGEVVACRDLKADDSPIDTTEEFDYGIKEIFFTVEVKGADLDENLRFVIKDKQDGNIVRDFNLMYSDNWNKSGDTYDGYFGLGIVLGEDENLQDHDLLGKPGLYLVEYYHNGYLIDSHTFNILE